MLTKESLQKRLKNLPEKFSIDELIEHLILMEKIEKGNLQSINDQVISENELDQEINLWFK